MFFDYLEKLRTSGKMHFTYQETVRKDTDEFIGFIGLLIADFESHFKPATKIGWHLSAKH